MDIFWGQMERLTEKVDNAISKQSSEIQTIIRSFDQKSEKISFVSQQLQLGLNKSVENFDLLRDIQRDFGKRLDESFEKRLVDCKNRMTKLEYWKVEVIQHVEQNLPLQIASIAFDVSLGAIQKKKMRGKLAHSTSKIIQELDLNKRMCSIKDYAGFMKLAEELGKKVGQIGLKDGKIYDCPFKFGQSTLSPRYYEFLDPKYSGKSRKSRSSRRSSHMSALGLLAGKN